MAPWQREEEIDAKAGGALDRMLGGGAAFREGQLEAIRALVGRQARVLVVQRTGWGKSLVYFIATRLLRDEGAGPTLLISPLLSLMRNQLAMADRLGLCSYTINSANSGEWSRAEDALRHDGCDILFISPERLANERFRTETLPLLKRGIGLLVIDEAHCVSDWGHDFRPDYQRIVQVARSLPAVVPVLATTATANDRVVADVVEQLGRDLLVLRGPLARRTLRLQTIRLDDQAERMAWLARYVPEMPRTGIIYCLTVADCQRVSAWLRTRGIDAPAYYGGLPTEEREELERRLIGNDVKALVATVALGMGFDKPDLGFVIHYQRPGSVVAYYQQIGRAGRAGEDAYAILLNGREDDEIQDYFIRTAVPPVADMRRVLAAVEAADGLTLNQLMTTVNLPRSRVEQSLKLFEVQGVVVREGKQYVRTVTRWLPDEEHALRVAELRQRELARMHAFVEARTCLMEFVARELDDPTARPCGRCAVCSGALWPTTVDRGLVLEATMFLRGDFRSIEPRKRLPADLLPERSTVIEDRLLVQPGRALCVYGDAGWGQEVKRGKYQDGRFSDELVQAAAEMIQSGWRPAPPPTWVTAVPSMRHPVLVADFAQRLAAALGLQYRAVLTKKVDTPEQKTMQNSAQQAKNIMAAFQVESREVLPDPVLLVDDIVDSRWTMTVCGARLRRAGSGPVYPFALATMVGAGDSP